MTTDLALKISKGNLKSILASMDALQEQHPNTELFLEINASLVPDGISYDVASCDLRITTDHEGEPLNAFETISIKEITEQETTQP